MKAILTIGYQNFLLPSETMAAQVLKILSKAAFCRDRLYDKKVVIRKESVDLEMKVVPTSTKIVEEEPEDPPRHYDESAEPSEASSEIIVLRPVPSAKKSPASHSRSRLSLKQQTQLLLEA